MSSTLYDITGRFAELFDAFDAINDYEPDTNADGEYIDDDGEVIADLEAYKADMLTMWFEKEKHRNRRGRKSRECCLLH